MENSVLSLLPPLVTIVVAIWRKSGMLALFCGVILSSIMLENWQLFSGMKSSVIYITQVFLSVNNAYIITFSLLIGVFVSLLTNSGAVNGFIECLSKSRIVKNSRDAAMLPVIIGSSIFTDSNLSMFTAGMISQNLFDKYKLSRARLAYLLDSTCAPVSILVLINGWGAFVLGLLDGYNLNDPVGILIGTIGYNFYAIIALIFAYYTAYSGRVFGPMKVSPYNVIANSQNDEIKQAPAYLMWLPIITLIIMTLSLLLITGNGDVRQGSGAFSVFWSIVTSLIILISLIVFHHLLPLKKMIKVSNQGLKEILPVVLILILSFAFGDTIKDLGTGTYISQLINVQLPLYLIAPALFLVAALTAFTTGTSWATFAILIPIAVPVAQETGIAVNFLVAAVLGGGIFGDHASPISDTTVVASIASGCDHFEHVKTQLPYAVVGAILTLVIYTFIGLSL